MSRDPSLAPLPYIHQGRLIACASGAVEQARTALTFTIRYRRWRKKTAEPYCSICLQDASEGEKMRRLTACGHCFHAECIDPWLEERSTCPECRAHIPPVPPEYPLIALVVPPSVTSSCSPRNLSFRQLYN
ncbi:hypothetical protein F2Q70_00028838 [Brassica cretica]|nr:hypothetical protein F2Q68_00028405 [Brassica cretica]KAF2603290.1 hypothetical protein F2Q70_00028838 [Brassica cretica]